MAEKCPVCHSEIGTYTDDPMLSPKHYIESLRGVSYIRDRHITEIRTVVNQLEALSGVTPTQWTPLNGVRVRHINELRQAIETLLVKVGVTLEDYLSADENGVPQTPLISDWLDGNRLVEGKHMIRAGHIEELRRPLPIKTWNTYSFSPDYRNDVIANNMKEGQSNYFHNAELVEEGLGYYYSNTSWASFFYQKETKVLHHFVGQYMGSSDYPQWSKTAGNVDWDFWEGYMQDGGRTWEVKFDPPLPFYTPAQGYGYEGISCASIDDFYGDYQMYTVELFFSRAGGIPRAPKLYGMTYGGNLLPNYIARYTMPKERVLGTSNGAPGQTYNAASVGIKVPILTDSAIVYVGGVQWTKVDSLVGQGAAATVYELNLTTGLVTFGNGVNGKIPTNGVEIKIFITLEGGGIWEFDKIIAPCTGNNLYWKVHAKDGKVWWHYKADAWEQSYVTTGDTVSNISGMYETITYSNPGYSGYPAKISDIVHEWSPYNAGGYVNVVSGSSVLVPNPHWGGTIDSACVFARAQMHESLGYPRPIQNVDSAGGWSFKVISCYGGVGPGVWAYASVHFLSNTGGYNNSIQTYGIVNVKKSLRFGYYTSNYPPVWIEELGNTISVDFMVYSGSPLGQNCYQIFDYAVTPGTNILTTMTGGTYAGGGYWSKTIGNITYTYSYSTYASAYPTATMARRQTGLADYYNGFIGIRSCIKYGVYYPVVDELFGGSTPPDLLWNVYATVV